MDATSGSMIGELLTNIAIAATIVFVGRYVVAWAIKLLRKVMIRADVAPIVVNFAASIVKILLYAFILIAALGQIGIETTSLVAVLGMAGLAVGLALKDSLQNFAAGVMMVMFQPFKIGHFIEAAGVSGVVEKITIFSTEVKTGDNREVIIPNGQIYSGAIINYSAQDTRRIDMVFGIGYDDDMLKAKQIMETILADHELVLDDPAPAVAVAELADSSVNFNVRPWVNSADYWGVRSDLIEKIKLAFDENDISIPYPQMDVHTHKI